MKLLYKPFAILFGILAGITGRKAFEKLWALVDDRQPPEPTTRRATWPKVLAAAAIEGVTFKVAKAAADRAGASGFERLTGVWPGPQDPEPK